MTQLYTRLPDLAPQAIVGLGSIIDRAPSVTIGATTAQTSIGLITVPAVTINKVLQRIIFRSHYFANSAGNIITQVFFDGTLIFNLTRTPASAFENVLVEAHLCNGNGSDAECFVKFFSGSNSASAAVAAVFGSSLQVNNVNWNLPHTIDIQAAKNAAGDVLASFYTQAEVL